MAQQIVQHPLNKLKEDMKDEFSSHSFEMSFFVKRLATLSEKENKTVILMNVL